MPGERTSWETITRSAPLITNVPVSVIKGISPIKISRSTISPVSLLFSLTTTFKGAAYVASLSLHSSMVYLMLSLAISKAKKKHSQNTKNSLQKQRRTEKIHGLSNTTQNGQRKESSDLKSTSKHTTELKKCYLKSSETKLT